MKKELLTDKQAWTIIFPAVILVLVMGVLVANAQVSVGAKFIAIALPAAIALLISLALNRLLSPR